MTGPRTVWGLTALIALAGVAGAQDLGTSRSEVGEARAAGPRGAVDAACRAGLAAIVDQQYRPDAADARDRKTRWARRLVLAHPRHVIGRRGFETIDGPTEDRVRGGYVARVRVSVTEARLDALWSEAETFLAWLGDPSVAVFLADRVERGGGGGRDDLAESIFAQGFAEALEAEFFTVVVPDQVEARRIARAELEKLRETDLVQLQEWSRAEAAKIYVTGAARAGRPILDGGTPGVTRHAFKAESKARVFWTDTGEQIATLGETEAVGKDVDVRQAANEALANAGRLLAPRVMDAVFEKWSRWAFEGRRLTLTFKGCDADQAEAIEEGLDALVDAGALVEFVDADMRNGLLQARVRSKLAPRKLARRVRRIELADGELVSLERGDNTMLLEVRTAP